jgi:hypothetical protein
MWSLTGVPVNVYQALYQFKPVFRWVQARHCWVFGWGLIALMLDNGKGTLQALCPYLPPKLRYWTLLRMVRSGQGEAAHWYRRQVAEGTKGLAQQHEWESKRWTEIKKASHDHIRFLNAFADAITSTIKADSLVGPWAVSSTTQTEIAIAGTAVKASWEDVAVLGTRKRRISAEIIGSALIGFLQEWGS